MLSTACHSVVLVMGYEESEGYQVVGVVVSIHMCLQLILFHIVSQLQSHSVRQSQAWHALLTLNYN